ncbi:GNAT family N-acetyltransferase [Candidatus Uabimicrobium sp. HlEnr_7]|uniref:GNAT family N-acetyltransferase n=1 Tax=Candidatus Uabimicrobium helgolandensis TaxID=3095367 RepID=UPI003558C8F0
MIESKRLLLKKMTLSNADFILQLMNDPEWEKFISSNKKTLQCAKDFITKAGTQSYEQHKFGYFLVLHKDQQIPIGICGLLKRNYLQQPDLGFAFIPSFRKQGYAYEAAFAVIEYAINIHKIKTLQAITKKHNHKSIILLNKLGFHFKKNIILPSSENIELYEKI